MSTCWTYRLLPLLVLFAPAQSGGADLYFMTVYGAQRPIINQPRFTHTWATFIRLTGSGDDPKKYQAYAFTISWLPRTMDVRPLQLRAEPGVNLTLEKTLEWCERNRMEVAQFGPYQIQPDLYLTLRRRFEQLERGELAYRASDLINAKSWREACNCIYAVLDDDGRDPVFRPVTLGFGDIGSAFITRRLSPSIINIKQTHPWVSELINVRNYPRPWIGVSAALSP